MSIKQLYNLTIPNEKVSENLKDFPLLINLGNDSGIDGTNTENIFDEFSYLDSVDDDFTGNDGDPPNELLWTISSSNLTNNTETIENNQLNLTQQLSGSGSSLNWLYSKWKASGDFDVEIQISKTTLSGHYSTIRITDHGNTYVGSSNGKFEYRYDSGTPTSFTMSTPTGYVKLTRTGTILKFYTKDEGASFIERNSVDTGQSPDVNVVFGVTGWSSNTTLTSYYFDNFKLNSGTVVWNPDDLPDLSSLQITIPDNYKTEILALEPYSYWRLNEEVGSTIAVDEMGNLNGTYVNAPTLETPGLLVDDGNDAITLNGINQYVNCPGYDFGQYYTLSAIVNLNSIVANSAIISTQYPSNVQFSLDFYNSPGKLSFGYYNGGWTHIADPTNFPINETVHVVAVNSSTGSYLYLNGTLVVSGTTFPNVVSTNPIFLGRRWDTDNVPDGVLDEVVIFDKALTEEEVTTLYQTSIGNFKSDISLPIEIDRWDQTNKQAQLWTKVPNISKNIDTVLTMSKLEADSYYDYIIELQPLAYLRFGENLGETIAKEEMGNYTGTYVGSPLLDTPGLLNSDNDSAMGLVDNFDEGATLTPHVTLTNTMSFSAIIETTVENGTIIITGQNGSTWPSYTFACNETQVKITLNPSNGSGYTQFYSNPVIEAGNIYQIVVTYDGSNVNFYINGVNEGTTAYTATVWNNSINQTDIAWNTHTGGGNTGSKFNGTIDELCIFDKALTESEITQMYLNSIANDTNPNIGQTGTPQAQSVWSEYDAVYHLSKDGTDSTANVLDGALVNMDETNIVDFGIGKGLSFNGTDEYIDCGDINKVGLNDFSIHSIVKINNVALHTYPVTKSLSGGLQGRYFMGTLANQGGRSFMEANNNNVIDLGGDIVLSSLTPYTLDMTAKRLGNLTINIDGVLDKVTDISSYSTVTLDTTVPFRIGTYTNADGIGAINQFSGNIKEVRFSYDSKSSDWIATNYDSTSDNLLEFTNLLTLSILGNITESMAMSEWVARAWMMSDGSLTDSQIVTSPTFELVVPYEKDVPHIVTVSPNLQNIWESLTAYILDDLIYPTDPQNTPFYYKCIVAGTSGETEPLWTTGDNDQITDDTITWELVEGLIQPITQFPVMPT